MRRLAVALQVTVALLIPIAALGQGNPPKPPKLTLQQPLTPEIASEINACKYLVVLDFAKDPYRIAEQLRSQARSKGFIVVSMPTEGRSADSLKTCVMTGSWSTGRGGGGHLDLKMQVKDAVSGRSVSQASAHVLAGPIFHPAQKSAAKIYEELNYTGYNEEVYQQKLARLYPPRSKVFITEGELKEKERRNHIEGIWASETDAFRFGIVPAPPGSDVDYVAVVLESNTPIWQPGEIRAEFHTTASTDIFMGKYFMFDKQSIETTFTLDHDALLRVSGLDKTQKADFRRVWPPIADNPVVSSKPQPPTVVTLGSGFALNHNGFIATNWHVVADAKNIEITFPDSRKSVRAEVAIRDVTNDLAVLRPADSTNFDACPEFPFQLASSSSVTLGERVSTIGYPLQSILGSNPKFSEGVVASRTGMQDDPRLLQISAEIQPGSSGGPLFDGQGDIVGIVVATLDAAKLYAIAGTLPQNVNWAVKSDYLLTLIGMLPAIQMPSSRTTPFSPEKAAQCIAMIKAW